MKILIRNLSRETTREQLFALFTPFGKVQSCSIVMDQEKNISKGFGFVEMPSVGEAKAAIQALNDKVVQGSKVRVKKTDSAKKAV